MKTKKYFVAGAVLVAGGLFGLAVSDLAIFKAGDVIKSADVNSNFSTLKGAIQALEAPVDATRLADGAVTLPKIAIGGSAADGKVLKLQGGALTWSDDLLGTGGGTAYSAGSGLALTGTTFSLLDGGVTKSKLSAPGGADGKVLKLSGGNLTWADDLTGGGGAAYSADGSSLSLSGATFAVKDGGIATEKIADQAVTSIKLAPNSVAFGRIVDGGVPGTKLQLPLSLSGGFGNSAVIKGMDSGGIGFGLWGESTTSTGVYGKATAGNGVGVHGTSATNIGVLGDGAKYGVFGSSSSGYGVYGQSSNNNAVYGVTSGNNTNATALAATSPSGYAAYLEAGAATCTFHAGTTGWSCSSDRNLKANFKSVNPQAVLEAVAQMPITTWNMKGSTVRQLGPTAQDFYAAFKLGNSDKSINNTDAQGVALAAIKGLNQKLEAQNTRLESENRLLKQKLDDLETRLAALEQR